MISRTIPQRELIDWFAALGSELVVEFPDRDDVMVKRLLARKREGSHPDYTRSAFEASLRAGSTIASSASFRPGRGRCTTQPSRDAVSLVSVAVRASRRAVGVRGEPARVRHAEQQPGVPRRTWRRRAAMWRFSRCSLRSACRSSYWVSNGSLRYSTRRSEMRSTPSRSGPLPFSPGSKCSGSSTRIEASRSSSRWRLQPLRRFCILRSRPFRAFLSISVALPIIACISFLATIPLATDDKRAADIQVENPVPVVLVVLDEFPVSSILRPDGSIDAVRYPGFAELSEPARGIAGQRPSTTSRFRPFPRS